MEVTLTFREMMDNCNDWDALCEDVGLNPWCMNEGLASDEDTYTLTMEQAKKHGII